MLNVLIISLILILILILMLILILIFILIFKLLLYNIIIRFKYHARLATSAQPPGLAMPDGWADVACLPQVVPEGLLAVTA